MWDCFYSLQKKTLILGILIFPLFLFSCSGSDYTGQYFSYPPNSKPHEKGWEYTALVIVSSSKSPITARSNKLVKIKIYDKNKTVFLNEDFKFTSASVRTTATWEKFEEINLKLFEVGNQFAKDSYNQKLLKVGPTLILEVTYQFDSKRNSFIKMIK